MFLLQTNIHIFSGFSCTRRSLVVDGLRGCDHVTNVSMTKTLSFRFSVSHYQSF